MNAGILTLAALVVAAAPSLLLEVFDRTRQEELRVLTGKDVPAVQHRTALRWTTAGAWARARCCR
jgi:hypothetical protein